MRSLRAVLGRRAGQPDGERRRILAPSAESILVRGTAERQPLLLRCDRSPALFQLALGELAGDVVVRHASGEPLGQLAEPGSGLARHYERLLRQAARRGEQVWVHGQVQRDGVELVVVLHCPAGPP
jgi:hypothetical protein